MIESVLNYCIGNGNESMVLTDEIKEYLTDADNIYNLIGNCFAALCNYISNHQKFISNYLDQTDEIDCNPNIEKLNDFSEMIMNEMNHYRASNFSEFQAKIVNAASELELQSYMDDKFNQLTIVYSILSAIDAVVMNWDFKWISRTLGPLGNKQKTSYCVYFKMKKNIHDNYIIQMDRKRALTSTFYEQFQSFRFIDKREWEKIATIPEVKYFSLPHNLKNVFLNSYKLKIAVIPVSCKDNFKIEFIRGSSFKVDYSENDQRRVCTNICRAIEASIEEGSNIIVLPEYVVSPYIYEKIRSYLEEKYKYMKSIGELLLVFSGSTWTDDNNNVMHILNARGQLIGEYYKYSPYTEKKQTEAGYKMCEALSNPGKVCDLIALENIGVFLPSICRDMIDGEYTEKLARYLLPLFVVVSACSRSVASFENRQRELANKYFINTVLGNACNAVRKDAIKIGNASSIYKPHTIVEANIRDINRKKCYKKDRECNGCYYILNYDFSISNINKDTGLNILERRFD